MGIVFIKNRLKKDKIIIIFFTILIISGSFLLNSIDILSRYPRYIKNICDVNNTYTININYYDKEKGIEESISSIAMMTRDEAKLDKLIKLKEELFNINNNKYKFLEMPIFEEARKNGQIIDIAYITDNTKIPYNDLNKEEEALISNNLKETYKVNNSYRLNHENSIKVKKVLGADNILLKDIFDETKYTKRFIGIRKDNFSKEFLRKNAFDILKGIMVEVQKEDIETLKKEIIAIDKNISSIDLKPVSDIIYENYTSKNTFNMIIMASYVSIIGGLIIISMIIVNYINMKKRKRDFMTLRAIGYTYKSIITNTTLEEGILVSLSLVISLILQKAIYLVTKVEWVDIRFNVTLIIIILLLIFQIILCIAMYIWFYRNRKNIVVRGE
ncbi:hypothetical protein M4I33_01100 [Clostridium sp. LY3-2]|uniref:FtsX-like permease family protein n=1 Tax=Clostridium sp. LY3-2 TaxID=2942482 RepID=UPI0021521C69|nr:FtsX-like permease family protein [Clostridium sp. LY3-2]MCR6513475.1 hypothetical protein [Clostridium sp. LY3-2]